MNTTTKWAAAGILSATLVGGWLTASAMSSNKVADMLNMAAKQGAWPDSDFKIRNLNHQAGMFSSQGDLELAYVDKCSPSSSDNITWVQVKYNMSHLVLPTSLMRFDWSLQPTGEAKAAFEKVFQGSVALTGAGHVRLGQTLDTDLNLPALSVTSPDSHFEMSPTKGFVSLSKEGLTIDINNDKTSYRGGGKALELQQVNFNVDLDNRKTGTGSSTISFGKVSASDLTLEGLKLISKAQHTDDRYSVSLSYNLAKAAYQQHRLSDLAISYAVNGMHGESVTKLIALSGVSCGFQNMTNEEEQQMRGALKTILTQGMSTGFTQLNAKLENGKVEGQLMVELAKSAQGHVSLAQHLKVLGDLKVEGQILSAEQQKSIVDVGFAKATPQGLMASVQFANQKLLLNDKDFNSPMVTMMLSELDNKIQHWFEHGSRPRDNNPLEELMSELPDADLPAEEAPPPAPTTTNSSEN